MTIDGPVSDSILNYSIVSSDEESENGLVLKLRVSDKCKKKLMVVIDRLGSTSPTKPGSNFPCSPTHPIESIDSSSGFVFEEENTEQDNAHSISKENKYVLTDEIICTESQIMKGSTKKKEKVVDVDDINTQRKLRTRSQSTGSVEDAAVMKTPRKKTKISNVEHNELTPRRSGRCITPTTKAIEVVTPRTRGRPKNAVVNESVHNSQRGEETEVHLSLSTKLIGAVTPKSNGRGRPRKNTNNSCTPSHVAEKNNQSSSLQVTPFKDDNTQVSGKRSVRTPLRFQDDDAKVTPRVNLDESFRRSVLRCRLNLDDIKRETTPRRNARRSTFIEYFLDSDDEMNEKTEKKSQAKPKTNPKNPAKRMLRSSSLSSNNEDENVILPTTPKSKRKNGTTSQCTPKTPRNTAKLIRDGVITPSIHSRTSIVPNPATPLMKARSSLHVSYVPATLPCREKEYCDIYNFLEGKLLDGCGGCMYISGVPGTGKTATVTSVISVLQKKHNIPNFKFVNVNGMRLTEPRQSYVEIWKQLTNKTVPWEQAQGFLDEKFNKPSKKDKESIVMLIDELDILCTKRQDVVYNLLDWPTKANNQLVVIAIANTMDLPERLLMSRVTSRLGLTRLTFQAYNYKQLQEIVTKRLCGTDSFNPDAIQLVARKVASVSGDARRALDICRRAAEMAEEGKGELVNVSHINEALNAMITQPTVMAIRRCSRLEKLLLQAIVAEVERTGVEETTFVDVFKMLVACCALDGFKMVTSTIAQHAIAHLNTCRILITDQKCNNIYQRIILNVSVHDVYFALKKSE